jgi:hypothetical protein
MAAAVRMAPATMSPVTQHFEQRHQTNRTEYEPEHEFLRLARPRY